MQKKRLLAFLLVLASLFSFAGCGAGAPAETTADTAATDAKSALTAEEQKILSDRRDLAEAYMRKMATVLWRASEAISYFRSVRDNSTTKMNIVAGRVYRGIPYSYAGSSDATFMDVLKDPDANGVYRIETIQGDPKYPAEFAFGALGNDCSGAVEQAWSQFGASITFSSTKTMASDNGFLPVGEYWTRPDDITSSGTICSTNGKPVMYAAYAQLQKADALVRRAESSGHTIMVSKIDVVYTADGAVNGVDSTVTVIEQTSSLQKAERCQFDETIGEDIYPIYKLDQVYSFAELYNEGYLPITCKELIDPDPVAEPEIKDSLTEFNKDTILTGTISCNWAIDKVTVVISDGSGKEVQRASVVSARGSVYSFDVADRFADTNPLKKCVIGSVDVTKLEAGQYRCVVLCRLTTGAEHTVRDFTFTV